MQDFLTAIATATEIAIAAYFIIPVIQWTLGKDTAQPALELVEAVLEEIDPLPAPRLPCIPVAPKPLYAPVTRVKTIRKTAVKKSEAIATETKVKTPSKSRAKKQPE